VPRLLDTHYDDYERGYYDYRDNELTDYRTRSQLLYQSPADSRSRRTCLGKHRLILCDTILYFYSYLL